MKLKENFIFIKSMEESIIFEVFDGEQKLKVQKSCLGNIKQDKYLGGGSTGEVVSACLDNEEKCIHVVKIINTDNAEYEEQKFNTEIAMSKIADKLDIGPKFIKSVSCPTWQENDGEIDYKFIVLEKYDYIIGDYLQIMNNIDQANSLSQYLLELVNKCYTYRFYHGDLYYPETRDINEGNIMLNVDNNKNVTKVVLIDFEHSQVGVEDIAIVKKEWCNTIRYLRKTYPLLKNSLVDENIIKQCL